MPLLQPVQDMGVSSFLPHIAHFITFFFFFLNTGYSLTSLDCFGLAVFIHHWASFFYWGLIDNLEITLLARKHELFLFLDDYFLIALLICQHIDVISVFGRYVNKLMQRLDNENITEEFNFQIGCTVEMYGCLWLPDLEETALTLMVLLSSK